MESQDTTVFKGFLMAATEETVVTGAPQRAGKARRVATAVAAVVVIPPVPAPMAASVERVVTRSEAEAAMVELGAQPGISAEPFPWERAAMVAMVATAAAPRPGAEAMAVMVEMEHLLETAEREARLVGVLPGPQALAARGAWASLTEPTVRLALLEILIRLRLRSLALRARLARLT